MSCGCRLFFAGDVALTSAKSVSEAFSEEVCNIIRSHDFSCCNFEAPIEHSDMNAAEKVGPLLFQQKEAASIVEQAGFNIIDIANNHMLDYGFNGLRNTMNAFKTAVVRGASDKPEEVYEPYITQMNGIALGFIMVAENGFGCANENGKAGYAWMCDERVERAILDTKARVDILIVNCHAGAERWEYPLPEIRKLYKKWIDMGVNIVIGHHPHTVQGWEQYHDGLICYSLGNFNFEAAVGEKYENTIGVSIKIDAALNIKHDIIYFTKTGERLDIGATDEFISYYDSINRILCSDEYQDKINECVKDAYNKMFVDYYYRVMGLYRGGLKAKVKSFVKRIILREKFSEKWLFHNLAIESHYWITKRALNERVSENNE